MNLQKLVSSEASYQKFKQKTLQTISNDPQKQNVLRNVVLFCKQVFSSNSNQRKKYLCLLVEQFVKDIFQNINSQYYEKLVDEYLASKVLLLVQAYIENKKQSKIGSNCGRIIDQDKQYGQKTYNFAVETIIFWAKRLCRLEKSSFSLVYQELKKMKIEMPSDFANYKKDKLIQLWKTQQSEQNSMVFENPTLKQLDFKFKHCKEQLEYSINESVLNDSEVNPKPLIQSLRQFLLLFFSKYRELQTQQTQERDIIIVYFHILNNLYKRVCNQIHISIQQIINLTKEIFETEYPPAYDSVDRMDMIELAGVFKYNALTVFQKIHQRIQKQDALMGPFEIKINLQIEQKPSLPSAFQGNGSTSRLRNQKFSRTNL